MAKNYRDIVNPITPREWFLHYLFTDERFLALKGQFQADLDSVDFIGPGSEDKERNEREKVTDYYVGLLSEEFNVSEDVARKGLRYKKYSRVLNEGRIPVADIKGDRITISVGPETRLEDVEYLWKIRVTHLQTKLPGYVSQRTVPASEPLFGYLVFKELRSGESMLSIYERYRDGRLDPRLEAHPATSPEDFRTYYRDIVKGYIKQA